LKEEEKKVERDNATAQKALAAKHKATVALAQQIVNKVNTPLNKLNTLMSTPDAQHLPTFIADSAKNHAMNLHGVLRQAYRALTDPSPELTVSSIKEVTKMLTDSRKVEVLMSQLLLTMSKAK
jgi:hypothetical protein